MKRGSAMGYKLIELYKNTDVEDYLEEAISVAEWIKKYEIKAPTGKYWAISGTEGKVPDEVESSFLGNRSIYAGAAGIGYFFIQLFDATKDSKWLNEAIEAADYLISTYDEKLSEKPGIHSGTSGEGLFLILLYERTGNKEYLNQAVKIADDVYKVAVKDEKGIHWNSYFDYMGDGGVIAYWLKIAEVTGDKKYIAYAKETLDSILELKVDYGEDSVYWKLFDPHEYFKTVPAGGIVPNFAHGTAGILYLLTKYYEATKEEKYLDYAIKGYNFLKSIAISDDDTAIVPYIYLEKEKKPYDVFYLGYCHGPVGDGIAVLELYKATGDEEYLDFYKKLTNALIAAGVPEKKSAGYWNDCICCGSAGALLHFTKASEYNDKYLEYAKRTADKSISDSYRDKDGARWYNAWTRIKPWDVDAHLGLFVGAAGSASALLSLYGKLKGIDIAGLYEYSE